MSEFGRGADLSSRTVIDVAIDAAAVLYGLNKEYAPFFCAQCGCSYCGPHWKLKPSFDYGFDYYSGHCPVGHRQFIEH